MAAMGLAVTLSNLRSEQVTVSFSERPTRTALDSSFSRTALEGSFSKVTHAVFHALSQISRQPPTKATDDDDVSSESTFVTREDSVNSIGKVTKVDWS